MPASSKNVNHLVEQFDRELAIASTMPDKTTYVHPITPATSRAVNNYEMDGDERLLVIEETVETKNVTEIEYDPDKASADEVLAEYIENKEEFLQDKIYDSAVSNIMFTSAIFVTVITALLVAIVYIRRRQMIRSSRYSSYSRPMTSNIGMQSVHTMV